VKKIVIIIVFLLVVGLALTYILTQMETGKTGRASAKKMVSSPAFKAQPSAMASMLPETAAIYVAISDVSKIRDTVETSNYYKRLSTSSFWKENVAPSFVQLDEKLRLASAELKGDVTTDLIWEVLGDDVGFALSQGAAEGEWAVSFIAKIGDKKKLSNLVSLIRASLEDSKQANVTESSHKGVKITTAVEPGGKQEVSFCSVSGCLAVSSKLDTLKTIIGLSQGKTDGSLANSARYRALAQELEPGYFLDAFIDLENLTEAIAAAMTASLPGFPQQPPMQGIPKTAGQSLARGYIKNGLLFDGLTVLDKEKTDEQILAMYKKFKPEVLPILSFIPKGAIFVGAMNCLSAKMMYEIALQSASNQNPMIAILASGYAAELEKNIGLSLTEDLLPAVGSDAGFYFKGLDLAQVLSLPELGFVCSSEDPDKLFTAFPKIGDYMLSFAKDKAPKATHVDDEYKGYKIHEIRLPMPIGEMTLAAAVLDKHFLIGFGRSQVNTMIDCMSGKHELFKDESRYSKISGEFPKESNQILYVDFENLWGQIRIAIERFGGSSADTKSTLEFVDMLVAPLKASFSTTIYESDRSQRVFGHVLIEAD